MMKIKQQHVIIEAKEKEKEKEESSCDPLLEKRIEFLWKLAVHSLHSNPKLSMKYVSLIRKLSDDTVELHTVCTMCNLICIPNYTCDVEVDEHGTVIHKCKLCKRSNSISRKKIVQNKDLFFKNTKENILPQNEFLINEIDLYEIKDNRKEISTTTHNENAEKVILRERGKITTVLEEIKEKNNIQEQEKKLKEEPIGSTKHESKETPNTQKIKKIEWENIDDVFRIVFDSTSEKPKELKTNNKRDRSQNEYEQSNKPNKKIKNQLQKTNEFLDLKKRKKKNNIMSVL